MNQADPPAPGIRCDRESPELPDLPRRRGRDVADLRSPTLAPTSSRRPNRNPHDRAIRTPRTLRE